MQKTLKSEVSLINLNIVFENTDFIIINKSHGIPVAPDCKDIGRECLHQILKQKYNNNIYMIHRLDAGTAGLMVWAKNKKTQRELSCQFENGEVYKEYIAVAKGKIANPLSIIAPITKKNYHGRYKINFENGLQARTTIYPLKHLKKNTMLKIILHTGRTHQIRVHLKHIKHPIAVDYQYNLSTKFDEKRLTLMCSKLCFCYNGKKVEYEAEISDFIQSWIN